MKIKECLEVGLQKMQMHLDDPFSLEDPQYVQEKIDEIDDIRFCLDLIETWEIYRTEENECAVEVETIE